MLLGLARADRGPGDHRRQAYADLPHPPASVGAVIAPDVFHPGRSGRDGLRVLGPRRRRRATRGSTSCSRSSASPTRRGARVRRTRSGCGSGWRSPARCSATRRRSSSTSRPTASTRTACAGCAGLLRALAAEGRTVLVSSHQLAELGQTVDDVALIDRGRIVAHAPMSELLPDPSASLEDVFLARTTDRKEH